MSEIVLSRDALAASGMADRRSGPQAFRRALVSGEIAMRAYVSEPADHKLARDVCRLRCAVLEQQPAAALEVPRCGADDLTQCAEPVGPARKRTARLERERRTGEHRISRGDVWRVAHDEIEAPSLERCEPAAFDEFHVRN